MALISYTNIVDGTGIDASDVNNPFNTMYNDYNGNITDANIASAANITASKLAGGVSGMFGAWSSYTPTLTNATLGNGTIVGNYIQLGKTVLYSIKFTLGSTSAIGSGPNFSLPTSSGSFYSYNHILGNVNVKDTSAVTFYHLLAVWASSTTVDLRELIASGTYLTHDQPSATSPFTWATTDIISIDGSYQAA